MPAFQRVTKWSPKPVRQMRQRLESVPSQPPPARAPTLPHSILALSLLRRSSVNRLPLVSTTKYRRCAAVLLHQDGPVGVIGSQRRGHLEPARQLGVQLDGVVLLQRVGEVALGGRSRRPRARRWTCPCPSACSSGSRSAPCLEQLLGVDVLVAKRWYLMPSTRARRLQRLMISAVSSMNCCGLRLKSSSRPLAQDGDDHAAAGELGAVLEVGEQVRQLDVALVQDTVAAPAVLRGLHAGLADGDVGLAPLQPGLGDGRGLSSANRCSRWISLSLSNCTR
jgi:hypothetical protein